MKRQATKRSEYLYVGQNKQEEDTQGKDALDRRILCDLYLSALVTFLVGVTNFCARIRKAQEFQALQDEEKEKEKDAIAERKATAAQKKKDVEREKEEKRIRRQLEKDARDERKEIEAIQKAARKVELAEERARKKEAERASINARKRAREELYTIRQSPKKARTSQQNRVQNKVVEVEEEAEIPVLKSGRGRRIQLPQRFKK